VAVGVRSEALGASERQATVRTPETILASRRVNVAVVGLDADCRTEVLLTAWLPAQVSRPSRRLRQFQMAELVLMSVQSVDRRERLRARVTQAVGVLAQIYFRFRYNDAVFRRCSITTTVQLNAIKFQIPKFTNSSLNKFTVLYKRGLSKACLQLGLLLARLHIV